MSSVYEGHGEPSFDLKKNGKTLIIKRIGCYSAKYKLNYTETITYDFNNEEEANQFYYAKLQEFKDDLHNFEI